MLGIRPFSLQCLCRRVSSTMAAQTSIPTATPAKLPMRDALAKLCTQQLNVYAKLLVESFPFSVVRTDLIITHRIPSVQVGDILVLDEICEVGSTDYKLCGLPLLPKGAVKVTATVMEHGHGKKIRARMRRQRKGRRPMKTIKPRTTTLRIQDIIINPDYQ